MTQKRRSRLRWKKLVGKFETSGLSHDDFCVRHGVNVGTFRSWLYRLRKEREDAGREEVALEFVEVCGAPAAVELVLRVRLGDAVLEFEQPPAAGWLAELLNETRRLSSC